jgi:hypothetical protein
MPEAGTIVSNLKRVTTSYDEELAVSPETLAHYNSLPKDGESTPQMEDAVDEAFAENYAAREQFRWEGQERWIGRENEEMRLVNILHPHRFFRKLQRAGVDARIEAPTFDVWAIDDETGKPVSIKRNRSHGRIWLHDEAIQGRIGISARVWDRQSRRYIIKRVTYLQFPYSPEWSLMHFDMFDVPIRERYRGWRTALLHLLLAGVLTEDEVDRAFGPVSLSSVSLFYRKMLYDKRRRLGQ